VPSDLRLNSVNACPRHLTLRLEKRLLGHVNKALKN